MNVYTLANKKNEMQRNLTASDVAQIVAFTPGEYTVSEQNKDSLWELSVSVKNGKFIVKPKEPYGSVTRAYDIIELAQQQTINDARRDPSLFTDPDKIGDRCEEIWEIGEENLLLSLEEDDTYHNKRAEEISVALRKHMDGVTIKSDELGLAQKYGVDVFDREDFTKALEKEIGKGIKKQRDYDLEKQSKFFKPRRGF